MLNNVLDLATALADRVTADIDQHGGLTTTDTVRAADELRIAISKFSRDYRDASALVADLAALIPLSETIEATATHAAFINWFRKRLTVDESWRKDFPCRFADDRQCLARIPEACICRREPQS